VGEGGLAPLKNYPVPELDIRCFREDHKHISEALIMPPEDLIIAITDIN